MLQEVAAARHVVIMCGSTEIDGYAFCLGVKSLKLFHTASLKLQGVSSITYLIEHAGLRSKYTADLPKRFSLEILPLASLIDLFYTRQATDPRDKVYALLGMSIDDPNKAALQPDYTISWEILFEQLVQYALGEDTAVYNSSQRPRIESKGCILGQVSSVQTSDTQNVNITFLSMNLTWYFNKKIEWTLQASVKSIKEGDIVCLLQGASRPTIIRLYKDYFAIIVVAVVPLKESVSFQHQDPFQLIKRFPRDFPLVWDWEQLLIEIQDPEKLSNWNSFDQATITWNFALILEDLGDYEKAEEIIQEAIKGYEIEFGEKRSMVKIRSGLTPLLWAAGNGHDVIVGLLLAKDSTDPNLKDRGIFIDTPLCLAAENGHEAVVKLLLATGRVDVNLSDFHGFTPLCLAAKNGHEAVIKLLLATGQVDVNLSSSRSSPPLCLAAKNGHEAVIKLLLATGRVDVNLGGSGADFTPLWWAARNGHEGVAKLLLATGQVNIDSKDTWKHQTPLLKAARNGHEAVVKLLLATDQVDINSKGEEGQTPLSWAARNGHEAIVKLLLAIGQVDTNSKDEHGQTPLSWAAQNGHKAVVKLLRKKAK